MNYIYAGRRPDPRGPQSCGVSPEAFAPKIFNCSDVFFVKIGPNSLHMICWKSVAGVYSLILDQSYFSGT